MLEGGDVALLDATNSNVDRRNYIASRCSSLGFHVLYLESICDDPELIHKNCLSKLQNPDYKDRSPDEALADFYQRLENYKLNYEPLDKERDRESSYIRLFNVGEYIVANHCNGVLESDVVSYLLNTHLVPRKIWLCIHGETDFTRRRQRHDSLRSVAARRADGAAARGRLQRSGERSVACRSSGARCCAS